MVVKKFLQFKNLLLIKIMNRKFDFSNNLVIASHNQGKVREFKDLFKDMSISILSASEFNLKEPVESGKSFKENAVIKAVYTSKLVGEISISDDSGLSINALNGAPGIYSARWAGKKNDFVVAMKKINDELLLKESKDNSAKFTCALCLAWPDGYFQCFEGVINGKIVWPPRGKKGFGYDPIFIPNGLTKTFGEIDPNLKHKLSHRAIAFNKLLKKCFN